MAVCILAVLVEVARRFEIWMTVKDALRERMCERIWHKYWVRNQTIGERRAHETISWSALRKFQQMWRASHRNRYIVIVRRRPLSMPLNVVDTCGNNLFFCI